MFDRGFFSAGILLGLTQGGQARHYPIPAQSNTKWEVLSGSADDCLVRMRASPQARAKSPELPEHWTARAVRMIGASGKQRILLTSLLDRRRYRAEALAECCRRRWEMARAAIQTKVEPTDLSFLRALHILQHGMMWAVGMAPGKLPAHLLRLRTQMQFAIVEKRRERQCPRLVKALPKRYTVRFLKKDLD